MQKIPTLFKRDPENMKRVLPEVTPGCEWVLAGEGVPTRKYDGTCVMFDGERWWARREVKAGKTAPENFQPLGTDENTGKTVGWEPIAQSPFAKFHAEALSNPDPAILRWPPRPGTFELCGPKINGNPEHFERHVLVRHASAARLDYVPGPCAYAEEAFSTLRSLMTDAYWDFEGIVWHHPDGRMAKLKRRDFR